jgi:peroxiredoxin
MMKNFLKFGVISFIFLGVLTAATTFSEGYKVGDKAEDFKLQSTEGDWVSLEGIEDAKGYVVVFTCNTCPWAVLYEDRIIDLHNKVAAMGYPVIAINPNDPAVKPGDSFVAMKERKAEKNFPFKYVFDEKQEVFPKFGATKTPHVFVLDKEMTVRYIGAIDDNAKSPADVSINYVVNAVESITAGNEVSPAETKAIGCSIKVAK